MTARARKQHTRPQRGPWVTKLVEGAPLQVAGRELVPLVRVTSWVRRRASLYSHGVGGQGYGFVHMRPIAILDKGENGEFGQEHHSIRNETARAIGWLALAAVVIPWLAMLLVYLARRSASK